MQQMLFENKAENPFSSQNHLNIECGFGLFKAIIFNPVSNQIVWATAFESDGIKAALKEHELNKQSFSEVHVNLVNSYSTLIPNNLFEEAQVKQYLDFNFETIDNTVSKFDSLKTLEAKNCYLLFEKEEKTVYKQFNNAVIGHQSTAFIELNRKKESQIIVELYPTHFQLMHVEENQFKMFNCFAYENVEDLLYYITYALRQLKVEKSAKIEISGWVTSTSEIFKRLKEYLPNIRVYTATIEPLNWGCVDFTARHHFNQVVRQHNCG